MSKVAIVDKDTGDLVYYGNGNNAKAAALKGLGHLEAPSPPKEYKRPSWDGSKWTERVAPPEEKSPLVIMCAELMSQGTSGKRTQDFIDLCTRLGVS